MPEDTDVTRLLLAWSGGEEAAAAPLMDAVYGELRRLARGYLLRERRDHSLAAHRAGARGLREARRSTSSPVAEPGALLRDRVPRDAPPAGGSRAGLRRREAGAGLTVSLDGHRPAAPGEPGRHRARRGAREARPARPTAGAARGASVLRRADGRRSRRRAGCGGDHGEAGLGDGADLAVPRAGRHS